MSGNSVMSAPAAKKNGFPVMTAARKSPCSSSSSARSHDSSVASPKNVGFVQSSPLSIVTSATSATRATLNSVTGTLCLRRGNVPVPPIPLHWSAIADGRLRRLPEQRGAHAHADAERRQPVANVGTLLEAVRKLRHQPNAGCGERVATRDRAAVRVEPLVLGIDPEAV